MISEQKIRADLEAAANAKLNFSTQHNLRKIEEGALTQLVKTQSSGGIIRIISDRESRWSAHHLNEELVVRFKAGSDYGRADRAAINSRQYSEYAFSHIEGLIESNRFDSNKDTLIVFASVGKSSELETIVSSAKNKGLSAIVIAPQALSVLLNLASYSFSLPTSDAAITGVMHNLILHSICERFESEYDINKHNFSDAFRLSAQLDLQIAAEAAYCTFICKTSAAVSERINKGATIFLAGNGGSTCEANALSEYVRTLRDANGQGFEVLDLHAPDTLLCAYNDKHSPFARQIEANGQPGDVLLVYSTSGNSQNIIDAVLSAGNKGLMTIALLGKDGGKLANLCDYPIIVPSNETSRIQEAHALLGRFIFA